MLPILLCNLFGPFALSISLRWGAEVHGVSTEFAGCASHGCWPQGQQKASKSRTASFCGHYHHFCSFLSFCRREGNSAPAITLGRFKGVSCPLLSSSSPCTPQFPTPGSFPAPLQVLSHSGCSNQPGLPLGTRRGGWGRVMVVVFLPLCRPGTEPQTLRTSNPRLSC